METTTLKVKGMSCQHCVQSIEKAVGGLAGVARVEVDLGKGETRVSYDPAKTPLARIVQAIDAQGYDVGPV